MIPTDLNASIARIEMNEILFIQFELVKLWMIHSLNVIAAFESARIVIRCYEMKKHYFIRTDFNCFEFVARRKQMSKGWKYD